jgi:uncharacterized protein (TIGR02466 family)
MNKITIFSTSILSKSYSTGLYNKYVLDFLKDYKKNNKGVNKSNREGYQTNSITDKNIITPIFQNCVSLLNEHYTFHNDTKIHFMNAWINENNQHSWNFPHCHSGSHFSGVYYVKVPSNSGRLVFLRESNAIDMHNLNSYILKPNNETLNNYNLNPQENLLVLFPSHVEHMVEPNNNQQERVSISFNLKLDHPTYG